jgi:hypothetical protein
MAGPPSLLRVQLAAKSRLAAAKRIVSRVEKCRISRRGKLPLAFYCDAKNKEPSVLLPPSVHPDVALLPVPKLPLRPFLKALRGKSSPQAFN